MADVTVTLTSEEAAFVLNELHSAGHGHGSSKDDFEPECPSCTAADKLAAVLTHGVPVDAAPSGLVVGSTGADWQAVAEMVAIEDGLGTVFVEFTAPRPPAGTKLYVQANAGVPEVVADHTHSDYADGFDAGVEVGAQQFRDFLAHYAPVYVKDIRQWHRDFLAARNAGVDVVHSEVKR